MQTTSHTVQAEPKRRRKPTEGNVLWRLYREMGDTAREAFWEMVAAIPMARGTFTKHSQPSAKLGNIETRYFTAYRKFFQQRSGHDIYDDFLAEQPLPLFTEPVE